MPVPYACPRDDTPLEGERCPRCGTTYPVTDGIARFIETLPEDVEQTQRVFHFEHARFENSTFVQFRPELVEEFLADNQLPREFFEGKSCLDAGCGSGRWSYALDQLGADLNAMDLTAAGVQAVRENVPGAAVAQANLFEAPFAPGSFDFVMSWGVLHHTPDTRRAFAAIAPLVKPGGTLYVMVYPPPPGIERFGTDLLRWFMRRMDDERRFELCRRLIVRNRTLSTVLSYLVLHAYLDPDNPELDEATAQFGLFDAYSPRYNFRHSKEEVAGWFWEEGFRDVTLIEGAPTRVRGIRSG
ncbi:MAG: class I SAM-dependent methyltransferase [Thermoleophilaceae bacterium]|nr:class I SAM-dependent methyltransferase [Thermoleophilaceae bacterium]